MVGRVLPEVQPLVVLQSVAVHDFLGSFASSASILNKARKKLQRRHLFKVFFILTNIIVPVNGILYNCLYCSGL